MLSREATNTNCIVVGLLRPGLESTMCFDPLWINLLLFIEICYSNISKADATLFFFNIAFHWKRRSTLGTSTSKTQSRINVLKKSLVCVNIFVTRMFTQQEPHQCIKISNLLHDVTFQIEYLIYCFTVHQLDVPHRKLRTEQHEHYVFNMPTR
jgi:hypothetical protein